MLKELGVESWGFRPYSLRRGGATSLFVKVGSLDRVLLMGRWTAIKTAKICLNSGLAMLADIQILFHLLHPFHLTYLIFWSSDHTLEPAPRSQGDVEKTKNGPRRPRNHAREKFQKMRNPHFFSKMSLRCLRPSFPRLGGALGSTRGGNLCSGFA